MLDRNILDKTKIPKALQGKKIDVRYSSLIAKAQKVNEAQAIFRTVEAAMPFIQLDPSAKDLINADNALRIIAGTFGLPQEIMNGVKEVAAIRKQRADQQQAMIQMQQQQMEEQQMGDVMKSHMIEQAKKG
jgi:hypothetical protein